MQQVRARPDLADMAAGHAVPAHAVGLERPVYRVAKRCFDVLFALSLVIVTAPVWLIVAVLIRITSPGPIIYSQVRVGKNGRQFQCYKFRTMRSDADALLARDPKLAGEFEKGWKLENDPRITSVGRLLRRSSIDELPQILNVLRGDMSVVGPRPVQPRELEERFGPAAAEVTSVKPGLTSLWSVSGRSLTSYDERIKLELEYVRRRSFGFDLLVMLLTIPAVLTGRGAM
jgi:lipopolysaccharide/colanic/teichoic acid biosynthesis glycosyltransferase